MVELRRAAAFKRIGKKNSPKRIKLRPEFKSWRKSFSHRNWSSKKSRTKIFIYRGEGHRFLKKLGRNATENGINYGIRQGAWGRGSSKYLCRVRSSKASMPLFPALHVNHHPHLVPLFYKLFYTITILSQR